jgi:hypothetical protein
VATSNGISFVHNLTDIEEFNLGPHLGVAPGGNYPLQATKEKKSELGASERTSPFLEYSRDIMHGRVIVMRATLSGVHIKHIKLS